MEDTLTAGAGLCRADIVRLVVEQAPERIHDLQQWGVVFDKDFTKEGGHRKRRILHVQDRTGHAIHEALIRRCRENPNIEILENEFAIDLITDRKIDPSHVGQSRCLGCYSFNAESNSVTAIRATATVLAGGGAGKVYLYTSNWPGATGDGIAMAYRAGARVANLEFMQFHPTCLYHPKANNFLITEAIRGEGGILRSSSGEAFMKKYHPMENLAPRDIVARSIDAEIKKSGDTCAYLDITHLSRDKILSHFPTIHEKCLAFGIDITREPIPVVPAAHYLCGGILTDRWARTDIAGLYAIGENACSGLHGANRLASNSLLECLVFAHQASVNVFADMQKNEIPQATLEIPPWVYHGNQDHDEMIVISHMWDEIRRLMWNYVGIVRSDKRLERAAHRLANLTSEVKDYYWNFRLHRDILELRNIALLAHLTVQCALRRKESRGIHYNLDYPTTAAEARDTILEA
jgi:L-aspartate oxidase